MKFEEAVAGAIIEWEGHLCVIVRRSKTVPRALIVHHFGELPGVGLHLVNGERFFVRLTERDWRNSMVLFSPAGGQKV